jgi:hypothetical protein
LPTKRGSHFPWRITAQFYHAQEQRLLEHVVVKQQFDIIWTSASMSDSLRIAILLISLLLAIQKELIHDHTPAIRPEYLGPIDGAATTACNLQCFRGRLFATLRISKPSSRVSPLHMTLKSHLPTRSRCSGADEVELGRVEHQSIPAPVVRGGRVLVTPVVAVQSRGKRLPVQTRAFSTLVTVPGAPCTCVVFQERTPFDATVQH